MGSNVRNNKNLSTRSPANYYRGLLFIGIVVTMLCTPLLVLVYVHLFNEAVSLFNQAQASDGQWNRANSVATIISGLATAAGVLAAAWSFMRKTQEDREARENETHYELNQRYADYLQLTLDHPQLPVQDYGEDASWTRMHQIHLTAPLRSIDDLSFIDYKKTVAIYEILYTLMERAYLTYARHDSGFKAKQWQGWEQYIKDWLARSDFKAIYNRHLKSDENDREFTTFIKQLISEIERAEGPKLS